MTGARKPHRRDPAPSRWAYRLNRLWLTPSFRRLLRTGLPVALVVLTLLAVFGNAGRREMIWTRVTDLRQQIESRPEFMVTMLEIDGASPPLAQAIRQDLDLGLPKSSFSLNLTALRHKIETLDAVAAADLQVTTGGVLKVTIRARKPVIVWRGPGGLEMLDASGHRVAALVDRDARADLPLITGYGADKAVPQALRLLAAAGPLRPRIRGLVRLGDRRWDVVLTRDQRIMLPEKDPVDALESVIALDQSQELLSRDITVVDMRNKNRPTVRLTERAMAALQQARTIQAGASSQ